MINQSLSPSVNVWYTPEGQTFIVVVLILTPILFYLNHKIEWTKDGLKWSKD